MHPFSDLDLEIDRKDPREQNVFKRDFDFVIVIFPFIYVAAHAYRVYIYAILQSLCFTDNKDPTVPLVLSMYN
jgi:hypothetical protein